MRIRPAHAVKAVIIMFTTNCGMYPTHVCNQDYEIVSKYAHYFGAKVRFGGSLIIDDILIQHFTCIHVHVEDFAKQNYIVN